MIALRKSQRVLFSLAVFFILILVGSAITAPLVAPYKPTDQYLAKPFHASSLENLLGIDNYGRDILSRIIYRSRSALIVGIVTVSFASVTGSKSLDSFLMLCIDSLLRNFSPFYRHRGISVVPWGVNTADATASWGLMLKDARNYLIQAPWMAINPRLTGFS
jgi:ABC-type dipeptide/oligopeptide/nickel transport system permease subunit